MAQAQAVADSSRKVVEKTILTYIPKLTKIEAAILALDAFPTSVDAIQLQRVADLMYSGHLLTKQFKVGRFSSSNKPVRLGMKSVHINQGSEIWRAGPTFSSIQHRP